MKQVIQNYRSGKLEVAEVPVPQLRTGTLLVRSRVSLVSAGTERHQVDFAQSSLVGKAAARPDLVRKAVDKMKRDGILETVAALGARLDTPTPLGYSMAGVVVEVDPAVSGFAPGDRVACAGAGHAMHAEFNVVPKHLCVKLPPEVDDEDGAFVTLGAIALQGVRQAQPTLDERFVVIGLGLIGQLTAQLLRANGCRVLGFDPKTEMAKLAEKLGADRAVAKDLAAAVHDFTDGIGADGAIVTASSRSSAAVRAAVDACRMKGRVVVVGLVGMDFERQPLYRKELDLRLSMSYGPGRYDPQYEEGGQDYPIAYVRWTEERNMAAFVRLLATGKVSPGALISHRFAIADAEAAYAQLSGGRSSLGVLLTYPSDPVVSRKITTSGPAATETMAQIGVGFVGAGAFARSTLLPALRRIPGLRFTGVATASGASARHAAMKFGFGFAATAAVEVITDPGTQAVVIATRHASHAPLVRDALAAGKHVFCEKPIALSREELEYVISTAEGANRILCVGFNRRFAPYLCALKDWLTEVSGPLMMNYRVNAGPVAPTSWVMGAEGGGRIVGEVCHFVDTMAFLAGSPVISVSAHMLGAPGDSMIATLAFANGSLGTILYSDNGDPSFPKERLEVFAGGRIAVLDDFRKLTLSANGRRRRKLSFSRNKGHAALLAAFVAAVTGQAPAPMQLGEIANVTATTFAIAQAARERREVGVEPFADDSRVSIRAGQA